MEATLCDIRRAVLTGKILKMDSAEIPSCKWLVPSKMLTVFVSSTFTDTHVERNILLAIRSRLFEEVRAYGIQINLVDMRFGVKDENTLTHDTWTHCAREIYNCHEQSGGVYFLSLQSHKYGYMPLPKHLSEEEYNKLALSDDTEVRSLIRDWYLADENAVPVRYTLRNLENIKNDDFWRYVIPKLRGAMIGYMFDPNTPTLLVGRSVTEWETRLAMQLDPSKVLWVHRRFIDGPPREKRDWYEDTDETTSVYLANLTAEMTSRIPPQNVARVSVTAEEYANEVKRLEEDDSVNEQSEDASVSVAGLSLDGKRGGEGGYVDLWTRRVEDLLRAELNRFKLQLDSWEKDGDGLGLPGHVAAELLHHAEITFKKCEGFVGREDSLLCGMQLLFPELQHGVCSSMTGMRQTASASNMPAPVVKPSNVFGISLCVIGESGIGRYSYVTFCMLCAKYSSAVLYDGSNSYSYSKGKLVSWQCLPSRYTATWNRRSPSFQWWFVSAGHHLAV
jgi:hypothetical protein